MTSTVTTATMTTATTTGPTGTTRSGADARTVAAFDTSTGFDTSTVLIRYFAGARAAAGVAEERVEVPVDGSVADALAAARARRGPALVRILPACSFLLDGVAVRDPGMAVSDGSELDVLPPFAGG